MPHEKPVIVYTCVTNRYDSLRPVVSNEQVEFVCFTDNSGRTPAGWQARSFCSPSRLTSGHDINRFHKIFPHRIFPDHRYSIYVDGNIDYHGGYDRLAQGFKKTDAALGALRHPDGRSLTEEVQACRWLNKFDERDSRQVDHQLRYYEAQGYDPSTMITANYLLVRDHAHRGLEAAMSLWWSQLFEFSKRDQLSLSFVLWKTALPWIFLDELDGIDSGKLERRAHHQSLLEKIKGKMKQMTGRVMGMWDR